MGGSVAASGAGMRRGSSCREVASPVGRVCFAKKSACRFLQCCTEPVHVDTETGDGSAPKLVQLPVEPVDGCGLDTPPGMLPFAPAVMRRGHLQISKSLLLRRCRERSVSAPSEVSFAMPNNHPRSTLWRRCAVDLRPRDSASWFKVTSHARAMAPSAAPWEEGSDTSIVS